MKKILIIILLFLVTFPAISEGAGSVVQGSIVNVGQENRDSNPARTITFLCTGDSGDGTVPDTVITVANFEKVKGWYLYEVEAYPTNGGTAPDAADVFILDANTIDLLGSEDGGTTAYAGLNLIHATIPKACIPNMYITGQTAHVNYYPMIKNLITLKVVNQGTVSANWTIVLTFVR